MDRHQVKPEVLIKVIRNLISLVTILVFSILLFPVILFFGDDILQSLNAHLESGKKSTNIQEVRVKEIFWAPPSISSIEDVSKRAQVEYGKELITHTARYLGPNGMVKHMSNGMNCQNCHLDAGTKIFGNNYSGVASTYPKFRARSGTSEDIYKRINDCFERSLNGEALDTMSREMQAIKTYITFLGSNVDRGQRPDGSGLKDLAWLDREADPGKGKLIYNAKCVTCHQPNGEGQLAQDGREYTYPPLWGASSYNDGAGLYRLSNFARYVKYNMPIGATHVSPLLTDEEAWDVSAFINTQFRPHLSVPNDWPDISKKPIDHPFGPFVDTFPEKQHKYGPFKPISERQVKSSSNSPSTGLK